MSSRADFFFLHTSYLCSDNSMCDVWFLKHLEVAIVTVTVPVLALCKGFDDGYTDVS
jgi:hypothetical protein